MDQKYIIALEFSGSQVKAALAKTAKSTNGAMATPTIEAIAHADKTGCVQYGRVQNIVDAADDASFLLQALEAEPAIDQARIVCAYVGLAGRSLGTVRTTAELTLSHEQQITDDILHRLFVEATKPVPADKKVLKVLPRKYVVDNQVNQNPVGALGKKVKGEFTVVTCNPINRRNLELVLNDKMKLPVCEYVVTPLALADMALAEEEKQLGCALVDLGAQTTTISIYKDRALQSLVTLPLGSNNITLDIANGLSKTLEQAEKDKIELGNAMPDSSKKANDEANRINCFVQARAGEIIANIIAQLQFAGYKTSDLTGGFILTGRGAKLENFAKALEAQSKMKVREATIPYGVNVADRSVDPSDYASIISIALRAANAADGSNCVVFPEGVSIKIEDEKEVDEEETIVIERHVDEDIYWNLDSDKEKARREAEMRQKEEDARKRQEENRKAEEAKHRQQEAARRKEEERKKKEEEKRRKKDEDKRKAEEAKRQKELEKIQRQESGEDQKPLLRKMRERVEKFFTEYPEDEEVKFDDK